VTAVMDLVRLILEMTVVMVMTITKSIVMWIENGSLDYIL
jgi:hypothetical protein